MSFVSSISWSMHLTILVDGAQRNST